MVTAVIYARYSSEAQTEQSIEGQIRVCKEFAERNDFLLVDTYIDRAMTGTNDNRAAFQKMMKDCTKKEWKAIIVYKLDRFSRNKYEAVVHKQTLKNNGIRLVSAMENIPDSPEGRMLETFMEGMNQYYSEELKQKVNRGLRESWLKGYATGGKKIFGYDIIDKRYVINEQEAEVVRELFNRYAKGEVASSIAADFTRRGIYRPNGMKFDSTYLFRLLHYDRYTGKVTHQGKVYDNIFPAIISEDTWRKVSVIYEENKISPSRKKDIFDFLLSAKLVCGQCKRKMHGISGTARNGNVHYYYTCKHKKSKTPCDAKCISKQYLEDLVINATVDLLKGKGNIVHLAKEIYEICQKEEKDDTTLNLLQRKKEEALKASRNIIKAIEQGIITEMTKARLNELEEQIALYDIEINKEKHRKTCSLTVEEIEMFLNKYLFENTDEIKVRKMIVNAFIREIILYPDKVIITYNFREPPEPIKIDKSLTEDTEKQSQSAFSFVVKLNGSSKFTQLPPKRT